MSVVAMDVGQSHARAVLVDDGQRQSATAPGAALHLSMRGAPIRVGRRLANLAAALGGSGGVEVVGIGLSGFDGSQEHASVVARAVGRACRARRVVVASDVVAWHAAALGASPGVVAALGTGSIVLASDGSGRWAKADGWGYLLGDESGGSNIGRDGLVEALRAHDGRGGSRTLLERGCSRYGSVEGIVARVYGASSPASELATFVPDVAAAARAGDAMARRIWTRAGRAAGRSIAAVHRELFTPDRHVPIVCTGSLLAAGELLLRPLRRTLRECGLQDDLSVSQVDPIKGAMALATGQAGQAFPGLVFAFEDF